MGGAVMAFSLGSSPVEVLDPDDFDLDTQKKLLAIDSFRSYNVDRAFAFLAAKDAGDIWEISEDGYSGIDQSDRVFELMARKQGKEGDEVFPDLHRYENGREKFFATQELLAQALEELGLYEI